MGGREGNHYQGRSRSKSRGRHKPGGKYGRGGKRNSNSSTSKTREALFAVMRNETATRYLTYAQVKKQLLRKLKMNKDLQEIGKAMENGQPWNHAAAKPTRVLSQVDIFDRTRDDDTGRLTLIENPESLDRRKTEQEGLDMDYKAAMSTWSERKKEYEAGKITALIQ